MAKINCYRIQPTGLDLGDHRSETSNGNLDRGVHVFLSFAELRFGVRGWRYEGGQELVTIACERSAVRENQDYEGSVLIENQGRIIDRYQLGTADQMRQWASQD